MALDRGLREREHEERGIDRHGHGQVKDALRLFFIKGEAIVQELSQGGVKIGQHGSGR